MLGHHTALAALRAGHKVIVVYRNPRSLQATPDVQFEARRADPNDRVAAVSVREIEPSKRGLTSTATTLLSSVPQRFSVNFGLIYFMGERRNPSAPDVMRR
jgi:NAD(P)-dependent dehydrogenase (short-subunit alcohol dehydrogenase family)